MKDRLRRNPGQEEFSIEFGDVNGIKLFELFAMGKENHDQKGRDKPEKEKK
ncbi:hypothetical protein [Neobacillus piezotolerans]|uniref:hypothetical protein n=1 Tax=Neobacillus piezotolerans TaxID=2259171 RepID=UPI0015F1BF89|nr:hypothetical protein [Neobacillus piezotolerans]